MKSQASLDYFCKWQADYQEPKPTGCLVDIMLSSHMRHYLSDFLDLTYDLDHDRMMPITRYDGIIASVKELMGVDFRYIQQYVYVLRDQYGDIFYVGQTSNCANRFARHRKDIGKRLRDNKPLLPTQKRIIMCWADGGEPTMDEIDDGIIDASETFWINRLHREGESLTNITGLDRTPA